MYDLFGSSMPVTMQVTKSAVRSGKYHTYFLQICGSLCKLHVKVCLKKSENATSNFTITKIASRSDVGLILFILDAYVLFYSFLQLMRQTNSDKHDLPPLRFRRKSHCIMVLTELIRLPLPQSLRLAFISSHWEHLYFDLN